MKALRLLLIPLVLLLGLSPMCAFGQLPTNEYVEANTSAAQEIPAGIWTTLNTVIRIGPFVVDPRNPLVMYAGAKTGNSGGSDPIWKSTDGGYTWSPTSLQVPSFGYLQPILDPNDSKVIYAFKLPGVVGLDEGGIWKSTDGGQTWNQSMTTGYTRTVASMVIDPTNSNILYAGVPDQYLPDAQHPYGYGSLFKSYDGGSTWLRMGSYTADYGTAGYADITTIAIDPHNPQVLYGGTNWGQVLKSTNGGSSWNGYTLYTDVSTSIYSLRVDPNNSNIIYGNGRGYIKSTDGGQTVSHINNGVMAAGGGLPGLIIDPRDSNILYGANARGPIRSTDAGANWSGFNNGLNPSIVDTPFGTPRFDGSGCKLYTSQNDRNVRAFYAYRFPANISLSSTSQSFSSDANSGSIAVTVLQGRCSIWAAKSNASWITITSGDTGSGNGSVNFSVTANSSNTPRTGIITVEDKTFTITQAGVLPCSYALSSSGQSFAAVGGSSSVGVTSAPNCNWTVANIPSWLTVTSGSSGSGNGTVIFSLAANTSSNSRTATLTVASQPFTVTQDAALPVGAATIVQFSASSYNVNEGASGATIAVTRSGNTSGITTVDYVSSDSSARQRSDYTIASGTLSFASGEVSKSFTVLVTDNAYVDKNRMVNLILSKTVGASLGFPSSAVLTINDNDTTPPTTNPINDPAFFVRQHYYDFLNRQPDSSGLAYWASQVTQCGSDPVCINGKLIDVSNAFFFEQEFQQTGAFVYRLDRAAFGNNQPFPNPAPDPMFPNEDKKLPNYDTFVHDRARVVGGTDLAASQLALASAFVLRPEFLAKYPLSPDGPTFVDAVLATIKNDTGADLASQRTTLIAHFNSGGRGLVMFHLANDYWNKCGITAPPCVPAGYGSSVDNRLFIDAEYNRAFVITQYFGYLRRDPDIGGFIFWLGQVSGPLRDVGKQHAMVCSFITSAEYQQRFSPVVTHSNGECPR